MPSDSDADAADTRASTLAPWAKPGFVCCRWAQLVET